MTEASFGFGNNDAAGALVGKFTPDQNGKVDYDYEFARTNGIKFLPSAGQLFFNSNVASAIYSPSQFFNEEYLLYLIALHEIGHVLGFYPSPTTQFHTVNGKFSGANITNSDNISVDSQAYRGFHIADTTNSNIFPGTRTNTASPQSVQDREDLLTPFIDQSDVPFKGISDLDIKILADLGYSIKPGYGNSNLYSFDPITNTYSFTRLFDPLYPNINDIIAGTGGNDFITGNNLINDYIASGSGNDTINGGVGNDSLYGGEGNDSLLGGPGDDLVYGGIGNDQLFSGGGRNILIGAGLDANGKYGFNEKDTLVRSAFSLKTTFVIGQAFQGVFYNNVDGFSSTNPTSDFDKDYATIVGYIPGQDVIKVPFPFSTTAQTFDGDTWIFDAFTSDLLAKVLLATASQITYTSL